MWLSCVVGLCSLWCPFTCSLTHLPGLWRSWSAFIFEPKSLISTKNKTNQTKGEAAAPLIIIVSLEQTKKCHFCSHVLFSLRFSSHSRHLADLLLQLSCLQVKAWLHLGKVVSQMIQNVFLKKLLLSAIVVELPYKSHITVAALPLLFCPVLQLFLEPK